jgi:ubiquinone/menaquinone biosynthesis C-methylase UbiE
MSQKYDQIGKSYNQTRKADPRIVPKLVEQLDLSTGSKILDVGAGTGNYSYELAKYGFQIHALDPSEVMIRQGKSHPNLFWRWGIAEQIPFEEGTFDGVTCILSTHHFKDLTLSLREIKRVVKNKVIIIIFTADPRLCPSDFWYRYYFEKIIKKSYQYHPPVHEFKRILAEIYNNNVELTPFFIPYDLQDGFFFSAWRYPERYLDIAFCKGISSLSEIPEKVLQEYQENLRKDLDNGSWRERFGDILNKTEYDCGYFFMKVRSK